MKAEKKISYSHTAEEKEYCLLVMAEINRQIPSRYVKAVQAMLEKKGIKGYDAEYITLVRNGRKFNRDVADAFVSVVRPTPRPHKSKDTLTYLMNNIR